MSSRTLSASISSTKTCKHEDSAVFSSSTSAGAAVSNSKCVGGTITFSKFRGWGGSYYFIIYIDGEEAFETREINDQNSESHELTTYIDMDADIDSDVILKNSGNIEVLVIDNNSPYTDDVCSFREDCEITIEAYYEAIVTTTKVGAPSNVKVAKTLSRNAVDLTWKAGSAGNSNNVTGYDVQYQDRAPTGSWPSSWTTASGSPVTTNKLSVSPPSTAGYYRRFQVRTRGSAGSSYYSAYVTSSNMLRKDHDPLAAFTDPTLTANVSVVKALYITELQSRVNTLRTFYGLSSYSFTTCTAGVTKIAKWTDLVNEIRTAIDGVCTASGKTHADWIVFDVNCPRVDVIQQLRDVVMAL